MSAIKVTAHLTGMAEIKERMRQYAKEISTQVVRTGLAAGTRELKNIVAAAAPYDAATPDSVHIRTNVQASFSRKHSGAGRTVATVGIKYGKSPAVVTRTGKRLGARKNEGSTYYWKFRDLGTKAGTGRGQGITGARFMGKSLEQNTQAITNKVTAAMSKSLDKLAKKNPGKR